MEEQTPEQMPAEGAPPPVAPSKGKGLWIGIAVVVIVVLVLLIAVFAGLFAPPAPQLPEAVYHVGYPGDAINYFPALWANRAQWTSEWFFSEGLKSQDFIDDLAAADIDVSIIKGTAPVGSEEPQILQSFTIFQTDYQARFGSAPNVFDPHSYDAAFLIALAMASANTTDTNSAAFKQTLRDVSSPPGVEIRPGQWAAALAAFAGGQDVDYIGASGAANFDAFGEVSSDYEVWGVDSNGQMVRELFIPDGSWEGAPAPAPTGTGLRGKGNPRPAQLTPKIGTVLPLTGALEVFGNDMKNATILAAEQINANGAIWGDALTLIHEDSKTNPADGASAATKLVNVDQVQAIVGAAASSVSQAVFAAIKPSNILQMSPASTSPLFTTLDDVDLFWRTAPSDALQGKAAALYAYRDAGWRTVSVFAINNAYGVGLGDVFASDFAARGGQVFRNVVYETGQPSYDSVLATLFTSGPAGAPPLRVTRWER